MSGRAPGKSSASSEKRRSKKLKRRRLQLKRGRKLWKRKKKAASTAAAAAAAAAANESKKKKKVIKLPNNSGAKKRPSKEEPNPFAYKSPPRKFARNKVSDSPGLKNGMARTVLVTKVLREQIVAFCFAKSNDDNANPYVKGLKDKIIGQDPEVADLNIKVDGYRVYPGTNDQIETLAKNSEYYGIFQFYKIFDNANSINPVNLKAVATKIVLAYQKNSDYNTLPQVVIKPPSYDHPINHYIDDKDAARLCSFVYENALQSGEFWTDENDLVQTWFGELGLEAKELCAEELGLVDPLEESTKEKPKKSFGGNFDNFVHEGDEVDVGDNDSEEESSGGEGSDEE